MSEPVSSQNPFAEELENLEIYKLRIIAEAAMLEQARLMTESVKENPSPASEQDLQRFLQQVDRLLQRKRIVHSFQKVYRSVAKVAVILLIVLVGGIFTIINVEAVRAPFINWLINIQETHTSIQFIPDSSKKADLEFGYLPEGFQVTSVEETSSSTIYYLESESGDQILVMQNDLSTGMSIDTEGATVEKFELSGLYPAMSVEKDGLVQLIWTNNSACFMIEGEISVDDIIKIAEFIKY